MGSAILRSLEAKGYANIVSRTHPELDLTRQVDTERFFAAEKPEYVFLAAAKVGGILANSTYTAEFIYDNLLIACNVVHAARLSGVKKLLNLGSSCVYPRLAPQPMKEESILSGAPEPTNEPYAIAKIAAIKLCRYYNEQYGTDYISAMPTNLYGPGDNFNFETAHVIPALLRKFHLAKLLNNGAIDDIVTDLKLSRIGFGLDKLLLKNGGAAVGGILARLGIEKDRVTVWGSGNARREFLYADDLAEGCVLLMEKYGCRDIGEFINIGSGTDIRMKRMAALIKDAVGFKGNIRHDASKPDGPPRKLLDTKRISAAGWKPKMTLEDGIRKEYKWYLERQKT